MSSTFAVPLTDGPVPTVTAQRWDGGPGRGPVVVLAHGAGSHLEHPLHQAVSAAVAACGHTVVGFNFPYAQAQRRAPDRMPVLRGCYRDVIQVVRAQLPGRPLVVGGRSMGGRVASLLAADGESVDGLVLLNYPVVSANRNSGAPPRTGHWDRLTGPVLFCQGTRDRLFDRKIFTSALPLLAGADVTVVDIPEADHSFAVPRRTGLTPAQVHARVGEIVSDWLAAAVTSSGAAA